MPFNPNNSAHNFGNALALAQASALAYEPAEARIRLDLPAILGTPLQEFRNFIYPETDTHVFMAATDKAIIVAFRGTVSRQNWLSNGEIVQVQYRNIGRVHAGFQRALNIAMPDVQATLTTWSGAGRTLWFTGHSLGGALAHLAVANLRFPLDPAVTAPRPVTGLYTFGQPRIGSQEFCSACSSGFGEFHFRYVNNRDIVTRVPPRVALYWHTGKVRYIDQDGAIQEDPSFWHRFLDLVEVGQAVFDQMRTGQIEVEEVSDHKIANYINLITAAAAI